MLFGVGALAVVDDPEFDRQCAWWIFGLLRGSTIPSGTIGIGETGVGMVKR